jgi:hypothetical protein
MQPVIPALKPKLNAGRCLFAGALVLVAGLGIFGHVQMEKRMATLEHKPVPELPSEEPAEKEAFDVLQASVSSQLDAFRVQLQELLDATHAASSAAPIAGPGNTVLQGQEAIIFDENKFRSLEERIGRLEAWANLLSDYLGLSKQAVKPRPGGPASR